MTYQVIRQTNQWTPRGDWKNVTRKVVGSYDTLGFALAARDNLDDPQLWAATNAVRFDVCDLAGNILFLSDLWKEMLLPERFQEMLDEIVIPF